MNTHLRNWQEKNTVATVEKRTRVAVPSPRARPTHTWGNERNISRIYVPPVENVISCEISTSGILVFHEYWWISRFKPRILRYIKIGFISVTAFIKTDVRTLIPQLNRHDWSVHVFINTHIMVEPITTPFYSIVLLIFPYIVTWHTVSMNCIPSGIWIRFCNSVHWHTRNVEVVSYMLKPTRVHWSCPRVFVWRIHRP